MLFIGIIALWSGAAFLADRLVIDVNGRPALPTKRFLASGVGRVLDIGAGTGRSSIMVLQARPHATLVATDLFGESFGEHFGHNGSPQQRLLANLKAAGVDQRATIITADMRNLPFESAEFDAVVSAYAMDHVNRAGSRRRGPALRGAVFEGRRLAARARPHGAHAVRVTGPRAGSESLRMRWPRFRALHVHQAAGRRQRDDGRALRVPHTRNLAGLRRQSSRFGATCRGTGRTPIWRTWPAARPARGSRKRGAGGQCEGRARVAPSRG